MKGELINMSVGQRKNLSPRQESNPWPPKHMAGTLSTELWELMVWRVRSFNWVHVTGILHSVRNSTIKVIVCSDKWIKMVNFKLGNEMWKVNWSNWIVSGLRFFLCPTIVSCWSIHLSHFITELKIHHLHSIRIRIKFYYIYIIKWSNIFFCDWYIQ